MARTAAQTKALQGEFAEWLSLDPRDRERLRLPGTQADWAAGKGVSDRTLRTWAKLPHVVEVLESRAAERAAAAPLLADLPPLPAPEDLSGSDLSLIEADYEVARAVLMEKVREGKDPRWHTLWFNTYGKKLAEAETSSADIDLSGKSDLELALMLPFEALEQAYFIARPADPTTDATPTATEQDDA